MKTSLLIRIVVAAAVLLQAGAALASTTRVWQGPANGAWSVAGNWTNGVPVTGDGVEFGNNAYSICNLTVTITSIHFTGTGANLASDSSHVLTVDASQVTDNVVNDSGNNTISAPIAIANSSFFMHVYGGTLTMSGVLSGTAGLGVRVIGPGLVVFSAASNNTYSGSTTVASGTLELNSTSAGALVPADLHIGGTNVGLPPGNAVLKLLFRDCIADASNVVIASDGVLDLGGLGETVSSLSGSGPVLLGASGKLSVNNSSACTYSGTITGSGTASFAKSGTGTLTLAGTLGCPGLSISDGTFSLTAAGSLSGVQTITLGDSVGAVNSTILQLSAAQQIPAGGQVTVAIDGQLNLGGFNMTIGSLHLTGGYVSLGAAVLTVDALNMSGGTISATGSGALSLQGDVTATSTAGAPAQITCAVLLNGDRIFHVLSGPVQPEFTIGSPVSDGTAPSGVRKDGAGTMDFLVTGNTYTGITEVEQGVLRIKASSTVAIPGDLVIGNDFDPPGTATVRDLSFGNDISTTTALTVHASGVFDISTGSVSEQVASLAGKGQVILGVYTLNILGSNGLSTEFDGSLSGTGTLAVLNGTATLTLGGTSNFAGKVAVASTPASPPPPPPIPPPVPGNLRITGSLGFGGSINVNDSGRLWLEGASSLLGAITAGNNGRMTVTGNVQVTSLAVSSGGTATMNGSFFSYGNIAVASGGLLNGSGRLSAVTSAASGSTVSAGNGAVPGTLEVQSSTTFTNGSIISIPLNEASGNINGQLQVDGTLNLGLATLALTPTGAMTRNAYVVASYGALSGAFGAITGVPAAYTVNYDYVDGGLLPHVALVKAGLVTTSPATAITGNSVKLNGIVNPAGKTTSWYFQYGTSATYDSKTAPVGGLTGSVNKPVSIAVSGLNGGTTYHFQLVATNSGGPVSGADLTFSTPGPAVTTNSVANFSALSATFSGTVNPNSNATSEWFEYGPTPALGLKTGLVPIGSGNAPLTTFFVVAGLKQSTVYYYRVAASNATGTTRGQIVNFTTRVVLPPVIQAGGLPVSRVAGLGSGTTSFTVSAAEGSPSPTDALLTYQWYKNGAAIVGATNHFYAFSVTSMTQAGAYTCTIKNVAGSLTTPPAQLAVVDSSARVLNVPAGSVTTLTAAVAGNNLTYAWYKNDVLVPGAISKTLTFHGVTAADDAFYFCEVAYPPVGMLTGTITLSAYSAAPIILTPVSLPDGIVGGAYSFQIPVDSGGSVAPTSFTATGLPPGLTVNSLGVISGRINGALTASHSYPVTLRAANAKGSSAPAIASLLVRPFPSGVTGTYNGLVDRDSLPPPPFNLNNGLGGTLNVVVTSAGTFTGRLVLAGAAYPLAGVFYSTTGNPDISATATVTRTGLHSMSLTFVSDAASGLMKGTVSDPTAGTHVGYVSYHNPWNASSHPYDKPGVFNTQLAVDPAVTGNAAYPQGTGYAAVNVSTAGAVTWAGKLADGTAPAVTYATTLSQDDAVPVQLLVDAGTASAHGVLTVSDDTAPPINNNQPLIAGALNWLKNAQPGTSTDRVYKAGFPLFNLNAKGAKYVAPAANTPVLGLAPSPVAGTNNAHFVFSQGGLTGTETPLINKSFRVTPTNTADFSNTGGNAGALALTITASTGTFTGSFTLTDGGTRKVAFNGLLIPRTDVRLGAGFFLLPGLSPSLTTSPILSGLGQIVPGP